MEDFEVIEEALKDYYREKSDWFFIPILNKIKSGRENMKPTSQNKRCECKGIGKLLPMMEMWYDEEKELPFVNHKPNKCKCKNELSQYLLNGKEIWLCSNCTHQGEKLI